MSRPSGVVVYYGPSMLDGRPIVAIATGIARPSQNVKTGAMVQVWILDAQEKPTEALKSGADASVCGDCPLRGLLGSERACYVDLGKAPRAVFLGWQRGIYPDWDGSPFERPVRLGAYGDPAALPLGVVQALTAAAPLGWTGYTHQWPTTDQRLRFALMASVDSPEEAAEAERLGWRSFAAHGPGEAQETVGDRRVILCPAESRGVSCADCRLCDGSRGESDRRASIRIPAHGPGARFVGA